MDTRKQPTARRRQIIIVAALALALLAGGASYFCLAGGAGSSEEPYEADGITPTPTSMASDAPTATPLTVVNDSYVPPEDEHWITPGTVAIGAFHPGGRVEWHLTVHNGNDEMAQTQDWAVTTEPNETAVEFILAAPLLGDATDAIRDLTSSLSTDRLSIAAYDPAALRLTIDGFQPDSRRVVSLSYIYGAQFHVWAERPHTPKTGYAPATEEMLDWVIVSEPHPVLASHETRDIIIAVEMPKDGMAPAKWEFWVVVAPDGGAGMVKVQLASRWLVDMRA